MNIPSERQRVPLYDILYGGVFRRNESGYARAHEVQKYVVDTLKNTDVIVEVSIDPTLWEDSNAAIGKIVLFGGIENPTDYHHIWVEKEALPAGKLAYVDLKTNQIGITRTGIVKMLFVGDPLDSTNLSLPLAVNADGVVTHATNEDIYIVGERIIGYETVDIDGDDYVAVTFDFKPQLNPMRQITLDEATLTELEGDAPITVPTQLLETGAVTDLAVALPDGVIENQEILFVLNADGGKNAVITPINSSVLSYTLRSEGDCVKFRWISAYGWVVVATYNNAHSADQITVNASGAINVTIKTHIIETGAGAMALTMADGLYPNQEIMLVMKVDGGGDAVLTPTTANFVTSTLGDVADNITLQWVVGIGWIVKANNGTVIA